MKKVLFLLLMFGFTLSCVPKTKLPADGQTAMKPEKNEEGEWDLQVIDTQYDYFLTAIAKPMNFYTESYLKNRNSFLVPEWNSLYYSGRYRNIIESSIDYDPNEKYGLKFEYKLYQVFAYVQWNYRLKLNGLSQTDVR
ncbi:DUF6146 family protein [Halpernia frigidisoli]|uniref:Lipoprotein n=1 Tax=Halpernia frigidisoli TaxID=1125876 RepID=A0A1I3HKI4_9FLAO|nr:DUF6146 family protein [Halpernia frigidisoli]SFI36172.1 hypothetical protein SAMN05443292_2262 [Halpernia frigidisoli]